MSLQDPISDMLTSIRNGQSAKKVTVLVPASKQKVAIVKVLKKSGYIEDYQLQQLDSNKPKLEVFLKYYQEKPVIVKIKRVSRPGLRTYKTVKNMPKIMGGLGVAILSTSKGVMTDSEARTLGVGGEILCYVW